MHTPVDKDALIEDLRRRLAETEQELATYREEFRQKLDLASRVHQTLLPAPIPYSAL